MSRRKVLRMGHPVLRQQARSVTLEELASASVQQLIDDMIETMHEGEGVGLAAPQIGESLQIVVVEVLPDPQRPFLPSLPLMVLVNPHLECLTDERFTMWEGCLSIPDLRGQVSRCRHIRLSALDREGKPMELEAEGAFASVFQHECDHLQGILFLDRMDDLSSLSYIEEWEAFYLTPPQEVVPEPHKEALSPDPPK